MKIKLIRKINHYKRKLIYFLIGESLIIEKRESADSCFFELINTSQCIHFGKFKAVKYEERQSDDNTVTSFVILKL